MRRLTLFAQLLGQLQFQNHVGKPRMSANAFVPKKEYESVFCAGGLLMPQIRYNGESNQTVVARVAQDTLRVASELQLVRRSEQARLESQRQPPRGLQLQR